jgi:hypothetical protein
MRASARLLGAAERLVGREPSIDALVLESAIMPPYVSDLRRQLGLLV